MPDFEGRLRMEGLEPTRWSNGPGGRYAAHDHGYDKVIVVERGVIRFSLPGMSGVIAPGDIVDLAKGDRLELPAGTAHDATVGPTGVACLEAHWPAGTLGRVARRAAGTW